MSKEKKLIEKETDVALWRVNTPQLLREVLDNPTTGILGRPMQIFGGILAELGERCAEINDPKLNALMCRLAIYEISDPYNKAYDGKRVTQIINEAYQCAEKS